MEYSKKSVQYIYRPVIHDNIPPIPVVSDINSHNYIWWRTHIQRCVKGFIAPDGKFINPIYYFFLNFVTVQIFGHRKDAVAELKNPYYRDNDEEIFNEFWDAMSKTTTTQELINAINLLFAKPRGIAFTYIVLFGVNLWMFIFRPDKPIVLAYEDEELKDDEKKQFVECYKRLHPIFKRRNGENSIIVRDNKDLFAIALESEWQKLKVQGKDLRAKDQEMPFFNRAIFMLGSKDKGKLKGKRVNMVTIAEVGKWTRLKDFIDATEHTVSLGSQKWGMINAGGTSDDIAPDNHDFEDLFNNPSAFNFRVHCTYAFMVLQGFVDYETGKSDKIGAKEHILKVLESKKGERRSYMNYKASMPLNREDFFTPAIEFCYSPEPIEDQIKYVERNSLGQDWRQGRLVYEKDILGENTGNVLFKEDKPNTPENRQGMWFVNILKHPRNSHKGEFIATIDDVFKDMVTDEKVEKAESKNCMIIYSRENPYTPLSDMPVAMFFGRHKDNNETFEQFALGMAFYELEDGRVLYEYHTTAFPNFLRDIGMIAKLYHVNGQPGIKVSDGIKSQMVDLGNAYIKEQRLANWSNLRMLNSMKKWTLHKKINDDIGSALHLLFYFLDLLRYVTIKPVFNGTEAVRYQPFRLNSVNDTTIAKTHLKKMSDKIRMGPRSNVSNYVGQEL